MCFCKPSAPQEAEMDRGTDHRVITEIIFSYVLQHTEHGFKILHLTSDLKSHLPLFQFDPRVCPIFKHSQEREEILKLVIHDLLLHHVCETKVNLCCWFLAAPSHPTV